MVFLTAGPHSMSLIALCALFATVGTGCVPPESSQFNKPVASAAPTSGPVILNGAGGKISAPSGKTDAKGAPVAAAAPVPPPDPAETGAAKTEEPARRAAGPVLAAKPLPPEPETPAVAAAPPDPAATPADAAITKNADGYPNINMPPKEPPSSLMPADERARVISELEALRKKSGPPVKDAGATQVAKKGGAKAKADGKCPDGATAATDPDCKASDIGNQ
jgi:hypothetical protein